MAAGTRKLEIFDAEHVESHVRDLLLTASTLTVSRRSADWRRPGIPGLGTRVRRVFYDQVDYLSKADLSFLIRANFRRID
jgi:hypothetical protein